MDNRHKVLKRIKEDGSIEYYPDGWNSVTFPERNSKWAKGFNFWITALTILGVVAGVYYLT